MASVNSLPRRILKPVISYLLGPRAYRWFHVRAKIRDIKNRLVEEPEMATLPWFVRAGDNVIDVGANFGYYTHRLAGLCGGGKVFAFEPIPTTFDALTSIVKSFRLRNVELHPLGVADRSAEVVFEVPLQDVGTPSAGQAHLGGRDNSLQGHEAYYSFKDKVAVACRVVALDDPQTAPRIPPVSFVKIDIEGAEIFALRGMRQLIQRDRPVILTEICPYFLRGFGISPEELKAFFREIKYQTFAYEPSTRRLKAWDQPDFADGNYILIHEERVGQFAQHLAGGIEHASSHP